MEILWSERENFNLLGDIHMFLNPIISCQRIMVYSVEIIDIGKISLTHWCQWNMQMQPSQYILWYLFYSMRYLGRIPIMVYVRTWSHTLKNV